LCQSKVGLTKKFSFPNPPFLIEEGFGKEKLLCINN